MIPAHSFLQKCMRWLLIVVYGVAGQTVARYVGGKVFMGTPVYFA